MKSLFLLPAITIPLLSAELTDLGILSPNRAIYLRHNCQDFLAYRAEFIAYPSTNTLSLTLTNELITISNLASLPSGRIVCGLQIICKDGETSEVKKFKFWLRRSKPEPPLVGMLELGAGTNFHQGFEWLSKTNSVHYPSHPLQINEAPTELPNSKMDTYPEMLDRRANNKLRRNE